MRAANSSGGYVTAKPKREDVDKLVAMMMSEQPRVRREPLIIFIDDAPSRDVLDDETVHSPYVADQQLYPPTPPAQEGRLHYPDAIDIGPIKYKKGES